MKRKIVLLVLAAVFLLPGLSVLGEETADFNKGILDNTGNLAKTTYLDRNAYDNNLNSYITSSGFQRIQFVESVTINGVFGKWSNKGNAYTATFKYYDENGNLIKSQSQVFTNNATDFYQKFPDNIEGVSRIDFDLGGALFEIDFFGQVGFVDTEPPAEIQNLNSEVTETTANFTYDLPVDEDFSHIEISKDGMNLESSYKTNQYSISGLLEDTSYNFNFVSVDTNGNRSTGKSLSIKTLEKPKPVEEIESLSVDAEFNKISLSWKTPENEKFAHVNIYRDEIQETAFIDFLMATTTVNAEATTKIFETNGTYFNDLTVKPETTYEYKLTTFSTQGMESVGVSKVVETPEAPPPVMEGGEFTKDPATGDFIYSWNEPTEGQVKVKLDGEDYKTVDSADQQIRIPAADMKYDYLGEPLVSVQPIGVDGKAGEVTEIGNSINDLIMPFNATDLLKTSNGLLYLIGGFVLLLLAFIFVPKFIGMIRQSFSKKDAKEGHAATEGSARRSQTDSEGKESRGRTRKQPTVISKAEVVHQEARQAPRIPREPKAQRATRERRESGRVPRVPRSGRS